MALPEASQQLCGAGQEIRGERDGTGRELTVGIFPSGSQMQQSMLQTETIIARIQGNVSRVKATTDCEQFPKRSRGLFTLVSTSMSW